VCRITDRGTSIVEDIRLLDKDGSCLFTILLAIAVKTLVSRKPNVRRLATLVLSRGLGDRKILSVEGFFDSVARWNGGKPVDVFRRLQTWCGEEARGHDSSLPLSPCPDLSIFVSDRE
jgi:hypothetical protein